LLYVGWIKRAILQQQFLCIHKPAYVYTYVVILCRRSVYKLWRKLSNRTVQYFFQLLFTDKNVYFVSSSDRWLAVWCDSNAQCESGSVLVGKYWSFERFTFVWENIVVFNGNDLKNFEFEVLKDVKHLNFKKTLNFEFHKVVKFKYFRTVRI
jgi:hypothetical protein